VNADLIEELHRAHVEAHGEECGRGQGIPGMRQRAKTAACVAVYRAWLHLADGPWKERGKTSAYKAAHRGQRTASQRARYAASGLVRSSASASFSRYRDLHRDEIKANQRAYHVAHRQGQNEGSRIYNATHRAEISEQKRRHRAANAEKVREQERESKRRAYAAHPEESRKKVRERSRRYRAANPEKVAEYNERRRMRRASDRTTVQTPPDNCPAQNSEVTQ